MNYFCFACLLLCVNLCCGAQNLTGKWTGILHTNADLTGKPGSYFMHMELKQSGNKINGSTQIDFQKDKSVIYLVSGAPGKQNQFKLSLTGNSTPSDKSYSGQSDFFIELNDISYSKNDTAQILYGRWLSGNESGGNFWATKIDTLFEPKNEDFFTSKNKVEKKKIIKTDSLKPLTTLIKPQMPTIKKLPVVIKVPFEKRKNIIKDTLVVTSAAVTIELYDNGEIDGDSVSIYLNNKPLLIKKELQTVAINIPLRLEKNKQYTVTIFAENLGRIPPNTAVMIVKSGSNRKTIYLSANLETNASIVIKTR